MLCNSLGPIWASDLLSFFQEDVLVSSSYSHHTHALETHTFTPCSSYVCMCTCMHHAHLRTIIHNHMHTYTHRTQLLFYHLLLQVVSPRVVGRSSPLLPFPQATSICPLKQHGAGSIQFTGTVVCGGQLLSDRPSRTHSNLGRVPLIWLHLNLELFT